MARACRPFVVAVEISPASELPQKYPAIASAVTGTSIVRFTNLTCTFPSHHRRLLRTRRSSVRKVSSFTVVLSRFPASNSCDLLYTHSTFSNSLNQKSNILRFALTLTQVPATCLIDYYPSSTTPSQWSQSPSLSASSPLPLSMRRRSRPLVLPQWPPPPLSHRQCLPLLLKHSILRL